MADEGWRELKEPWQRLQWARRAWQDERGGGTAQDAAIALGMKPDTYRAYERRPDSSKHSQMDHQDAIKFAKKFNVRWEWLLLGTGDLREPKKADEPTDPMKRAWGAMRGKPLDQQNAIADAIEALAKVRARGR